MLPEPCQVCVSRHPALEQSPVLISVFWEVQGLLAGACCLYADTLENTRDGSVPQPGRGQLSRQLYCPMTADKLETLTVNLVTKWVFDSRGSVARLCHPAQCRCSGAVCRCSHVPIAPDTAMERYDIVHHRSRPVTLECSAQTG